VTRVLVWQWGRRGAGPRFAVELASALNRCDGVSASLSLSVQSEQMRRVPPPAVDLPISTYGNLAGFVRRVLTAPFALPRLVADVRALRLDLAICAMPGPLDLLMAAALRLAGVPFWVIIHDAEAHPGDGSRAQMRLQAWLAACATGWIALSDHVAASLRAQSRLGGRRLVVASHPPFTFGPLPAPPRSHGGALRLLFFGRLLPYKGLDLFAKALQRLGPRDDIVVRVAGFGPESAELAALRAMPHVTVDNRWIPEDELGACLAWADALVLSYREASQSGVAAAALAARRWVVSTEVGGLVEQLRDEPIARLCAPEADALAGAIAGLISDPPVDNVTRHGDDWAAMAEKLMTKMRKAVLF
jgi:glycosyltransferase involved in cell wall biosynthesis